MRRYLLKRAGFALLSLVLLSLTIFAFVRLTGDPAVLLTEPGASPEDLALIRQQFGLDRPLWVQYGSFVAHLARGDFGQSFYYRTDVLALYLSRLPASLLLATVAMAFSLVIGIPTGVIAAVRVNGWWDSAGKIFALLGLSLPSFWVGLLLFLSSRSPSAGSRPRARAPSSTCSCPPSPSAGTSRRPTCGSRARPCSTCSAPST